LVFELEFIGIWDLAFGVPAQQATLDFRLSTFDRYSTFDCLQSG
jgi:hypothetical protein